GRSRSALGHSRPRQQPAHGQGVGTLQRACTLFERGHRTGAVQGERTGKGQRPCGKCEGRATLQAGNGLVRGAESTDGDGGGEGAGDADIVRRHRYRSAAPVRRRRPFVVSGRSCPVVSAAAAGHTQRQGSAMSVGRRTPNLCTCALSIGRSDKARCEHESHDCCKTKNPTSEMTASLFEHGKFSKNLLGSSWL